MANRFLVEQKPFLAILAAMQPMCTKRTTLDATSSILIHVGHKELVLKSTDLEISLQYSYPLQKTDIDQASSFLVSGRRIFDLVKELEGDIVCTFDGTQLMLQAGSVNLSLNIKDTHGFPPFPERIENLMHFDATSILEMLGNVAFLIPQNNSNPALNGLFLEISADGLTMTTTDGHCLAQVTSTHYSLGETKQWLIPRRAIFEIKKLLEGVEDKTVFLGLCGNQLVFSGESFNFFTKLLVDPFPQYAAILNKQHFKPALVDRMQLIKTLRRSTCLLSGQFIATEFGFSSQDLHVSMHNKEVGKLAERLSLEQFEGDALDIRFYSPYLLSGLQAFSDEKLTFYLKSSSKPIIFESQANNYKMLYLVMPVSPTSTSS